MEIKKHNGGYLLNGVIFFGDEECSDKVQLRTTKGDSMRYGPEHVNKVDYPGEYDLQGISVTCMDVGDKLHYLIRYDNKQVALLQNQLVLERENFEGVTHRICNDETTRDEIQTLELDGEMTVLREVE